MKRLVTLLTALLWLCLPATTFAFDPLGTACGTQGSAGGSSTVCGAKGSNTISGSHGVLEKATLILSTIAGIAAVITIIVAGLIYVTSGGNAQRIESARNAIIGALVGLVIIAAAASIITFVVSKV